MKLTKNETALIGDWISDGKNVKKNEVALRIDWLINNYLKRLCSDESGWDVLYFDPDNNRLWELTYPHSEQHGGGPAALIHITLEDARVKYKKLAM